MSELHRELRKHLERGNIVLTLCDTVYGLLGLAPQSRETLSAVKGNRQEKPFIELYGSLEQLRRSRWELPPDSITRFWPGPLTCILNAKSGDGTSQAVRIPQHPLLQRLCLELDHPLYSTSANRSDRPAPEDRDGLQKEFLREIAEGLILPYLHRSEIQNTRASTILDVRREPYRILRQGSLKPV